MNYVLGKQRFQLKIECLNDYVDNNSEVTVIDKIIDALGMEKLEPGLEHNGEIDVPKISFMDILELFDY